ncbi:energy-coupling factor ABC transporter ATP-binding protein [Fictibacillus iocasae]|uniref:Energy-coupling factor transporter ATP-binding protein EcfA2 n=1 Tax=Fictibacillus iocasae TaxID=2715437 RepID=A0ABW2NS11_9BACL
MDIEIRQLEHRYMPGSPYERLALKEISLQIADGTFLALIGHTGSGKSTLIQHLNGLLKPTSGSIMMGEDEWAAGDKKRDMKSLRKKVGIVFQYPEHQLFEETVEKDIMFGPMNFGTPESEAKERAKEMIQLVGLPADVKDKSPFDLSGGQMRRVAIAGVLAMKPDVLILDEPTAGLDPSGRNEIMELFAKLHHDRKLTTILVTHSMEDAAKYADEIVVMHNGAVFMQGIPPDIFKQEDKLKEASLDVPETVKFLHKWHAVSGVRHELSQFTAEALAAVLASEWKEGRR